MHPLTRPQAVWQLSKLADRVYGTQEEAGPCEPSAVPQQALADPISWFQDKLSAGETLLGQVRLATVYLGSMHCQLAQPQLSLMTKQGSDQPWAPHLVQSDLALQVIDATTVAAVESGCLEQGVSACFQSRQCQLYLSMVSVGAGSLQ